MENAKVHLKILIISAAKEEVINLVGSEFVFGRNTNSTVFINDPSFSRSHFKITQHFQVLSISDMGSSNGTFVNGEKLLPNDQMTLNLFDVITVADSALKIKIEKIDYEESVEEQDDRTKVMKPLDFSQQLFDVATVKINELMQKAREDAALLIAESHDQIEKERKIMMALTAKEMEAYALEKKTQIHEKIESEKKIKEEELKVYLQNENEKQKKIFLDELNEFQKKIANETAELERLQNHFDEEVKKIEADLEQKTAAKKEEFKLLEKSIDDKKEKQIQDLESLVENRKRELESAISDLEVTYEKKTAAKKEEFKLLEKSIEDKKEKQIQHLEAQVENRKLELEGAISDLEAKFETNNKEFQALFEKYDFKKNEHTQAIEDLTKVKLKSLEELKKIEQDIASRKQDAEEQIARDNSLIETISQDLHKIKKEKHDRESELAKIQSDLSVLLDQLQDSKKKLESEEKNLKAKKQELVALNGEIKNMGVAKEAAQKEIAALTHTLSELKNNVQKMNHHHETLKDENNKKIEALKNDFLQSKSEIKEEMRKLKEVEEKRLQEFTRQELSQINKIKEDSLRIVLDLEDSITKEITHGSSKVFASTIGIDKFREVAPEFEKNVRASLQKGVLKLLKNELTPETVTTEKTFFQKKKKMVKPFSYGALSSAVLCGSLFYVYMQFKYLNDPLRLKLEEEARIAAIVPAKKFVAVKTDKLGKDFVNSVIYTERFCDIYAQESFRSDLMKKGSVYLYKKWQINEEKSIQSFAMIFSLIDTLKAKAEKINPDYEKKDIEKMTVIEKETMKKLEEILGNEVRLEAALKFQTRFFLDYIAQNSGAPKIEETAPVARPAEVYPGE